jgi:hypothetical protein
MGPSLPISLDWTISRPADDRRPHRERRGSAASISCVLVAVGMRIAAHPPHRSRRAGFPHRALVSGRRRCQSGSGRPMQRHSRTGRRWGHEGPALCPDRAVPPSLPATRRLPSTPSAADCSALFGGFHGTTHLSDFSWPYIIGYGSMPSRCGPHGSAGGQP